MSQLLAHQNCNKCNLSTLHTKKSISHLLHWIFIFLTAGLWFPMYLLICIFHSSDPQCTICGKKTFELSLGGALILLLFIWGTYLYLNEPGEIKSTNSTPSLVTVSQLPTCTGSDITYWTNCYGSATWSSGSRYKGEWLNGTRHGYGVYVTSKGKVKKGDFEKGRFVKDKYQLFSLIALIILNVINLVYIFYIYKQKKRDREMFGTSMIKKNNGPLISSFSLIVMMVILKIYFAGGVDTSAYETNLISNQFQLN